MGFFRWMLAAALLGCVAHAQAAEARTTMDPQISIEAITDLQADSVAVRTKAVDAVLAKPDRYAPPVFYVLSRTLFLGDRKDEAAFWFYAGQLRARFDANRCTDRTAASAVSALNQQFGELINPYAFADLPRLKALIPRVVDWDRRTPHHYDHRWIALHGMDAVIGGGGGADAAPAFVPEAQWPALAEQTRKDYLQGFNEAMASMDKP